MAKNSNTYKTFNVNEKTPKASWEIYIYWENTDESEDINEHAEGEKNRGRDNPEEDR